MSYTDTISNIGEEINQLISSSKSESSKLTEEERINSFLDRINNVRKDLIGRTEKVKMLDGLFSKLTWFEIQDQEEEELLKNLITKAKSFHDYRIRDFVSIKNSFWKDNICRKEISSYKNALDDFEESFHEVQQIFFDLRKDNEFNDLMNSI